MPKKTVRKSSRTAKASNGHEEAQVLSWEEPPVRRSGRAFAFPVDALKAKKNQWAKISTHASASSAGSRAGGLKGTLETRGLTGFEVISRGGDVFARYTGKASA